MTNTNTASGAAAPEALRLADAIDPFERKSAPDHLTSKVAADELRRLHAENERLAALVEAQQPAPSAEKYDDTLLPFLALMRKELHANAGKGDRPGWLKMSADQALLEIYWHTAKLSAAVKNNDGAAIIEHSADVANMAMMLLDVCGGIPTTQAAPSVLEDWRLDHSAGRPILVYKDCSVIEAEQAQEVLDALRASRGQAPAVAAPEVLDKATKHSRLKYTLTTSRAAFQAGALFALNTMRDQPAPEPSVLEDAARYRWLRRWKGQEHEPPFTVQHEVDGTLWGGDLDAAIDAAMKKGANHD